MSHVKLDGAVCGNTSAILFAELYREGAFGITCLPVSAVTPSRGVGRCF